MLEMVKAIKRGRAEIPIKKEKKDRKKQIMIIGIIALLVAGWSVGGIVGFAGSIKPSESGQPPGRELGGVGMGASVGAADRSPGRLTGHRAIFGQLTAPQGLAERLGGELYLLDEGASELILTDADIAEIEMEASGDYIIYDIADCGDFDCLVTSAGTEAGKGNNTEAGTASFRIYQLDRKSDFLRTSQLGIAVEDEGTDSDSAETESEGDE